MYAVWLEIVERFHPCWLAISQPLLDVECKKMNECKVFAMQLDELVVALPEAETSILYPGVSPGGLLTLNVVAVLFSPIKLDRYK